MTSTPQLPAARARVLWSAAVVVGASLPHFVLLPAWLPAILCLCVAWRVAAEQRGWRTPGRGVRLLLAAAALAIVLAEYRTINGITAGSALLVIMVALKLVETRTHRDELVLMIICYFLVFASLLEHQSPVIGAYLLVFVLATTAGLLQLGRRGPLLPVGRTLKLAGGLLLKAVPVMVILFVLFPRLPGPLWALPSDARSGTTGLSDSMTPGDISELVRSEQIAFRVEFDGSAPPVGALYWRGPVLAHFDGRSWSRPFVAGRANPERIEYLGEPVDYRVLLEPGTRSWRFALDLPRTWSESARLSMTADFQLVTHSRRDFDRRLDYRVTSHPRYRTLDPPTEGERRILTHLPSGSSPRTRALVERWRAAGMTNSQLIETALAYFREQPFHYTLSPARLGSEPVDEFLLETLEGFCEHYASAFAVMMRAAGVPARIVTGYHGGERNELNGYYVVRQSDAHAWTEVWLEGDGWVRIDPTAAIAPERIERGAASSGLGLGAPLVRVGWLRTARFAWDALHTRWYDFVIGYGQTTQRAFLTRLGFDSPTVDRLLAATAASIVLFLALFTIGYALAARARRVPLDPAARVFRRFARRLERRRVAPPAAHETPTAFAERAARTLPAAAADIRRITAAYLRARYEPDPRGDALRRLKTLVESFRPARSR